jgi:5-methylcytosine-specific restriction endonuclease McrBC GTP-binding regulatory subunit McrB
MLVTGNEILEYATTALKKMLEEHGSEYKFPADEIWQNIPPGVDIPSTQRPYQPKRLMHEGLLELTGGMTRARSEQRAGSATKEYRFGPKLVQRELPRKKPAETNQSTTAGDSLAKLQTQMEAEGYIISSAELANFFLAITVSPLVILSGISGTGKSLLPRKFAKHTDSLFHAIPVQPQWSDNSDLFGFVPTLAPDKYIKGALIDSVINAKRHPDKLVIALLDEMNLAPVEHYFSDFLSVSETRVRNGSNIGSDPLPVSLPPIPKDTTTDPFSDLRNIELPFNLRVIGTANMDETTHSFSPKVLDRAFTIEFDDPDLTAFATGTTTSLETFNDLAKIVINTENTISVHEACSSSRELFEHISKLLSEIQTLLSPAGIKFGYRTRDSILLYLHFWRTTALDKIMSGYAALDFCILQKILPKISGNGEILATALQNLSEWLKSRSESTGSETEIETIFIGPLERSHQKVERMLSLLNLDGSTRYWGI